MEASVQPFRMRCTGAFVGIQFCRVCHPDRSQKSLSLRRNSGHAMRRARSSGPRNAQALLYPDPHAQIAVFGMAQLRPKYVTASPK